MSEKNEFSLRMKQWFRKRYINLKRRPHIIPLIGLFVASMVFTFNLSVHSNAFTYVPNQYDAFLIFVATLFSILSIFTFINYYQKRNYFLYGLVHAMCLAQIVIDWQLTNTIAGFVKANPDRAKDYLYNSYNNLRFHIIVLVVAIVLVILHPVYLHLRNRKKMSHEAKKQ